MTQKQEKTSLFDRLENARTILDKNIPVTPQPFPLDFIKLEKSAGEWRMMIVDDKNVVSPTTRHYIAMHYARFAEQQGLSPDFRFMPAQLDACIKHWETHVPFFPHEIHPVLQSSTEGYCYHRLDFDMYDQDTPTFDALCSKIICNKDAFIGWCGSLFSSKHTLQQYCWLYGDGKNGKGTMFRLLKKLMGPAYTYFETDPKKIDKFQGSMLLNKRLAVASDCMHPSIVTTSLFKAATGGDAIQIEEKMKQPFTESLNCQFLFGSNEKPNISSKKADLRRAIFVEFEAVPENELISDFEDKLWSERAGILKKMWDAYNRLKTTNETIKVDVEAQEQVAQEMEAPFEDFFDNCLIEVPDGEGDLKPQVLLNAYKNFYRSSTDYEFSRLKKWLEQKGHKSVRKKVGDDNFPRMFYALKLRDSDVNRPF